jgi:hypothetical protein
LVRQILAGKLTIRKLGKSEGVVFLAQHIRQLGDIRRDPPRFVLAVSSVSPTCFPRGELKARWRVNGVRDFLVVNFAAPERGAAFLLDDCPAAQTALKKEPRK